MKIMKLFLGLALFLTGGASTQAYERLQGPTQVIYWDRTKTADGYTLFGAQGTSYLINMEGGVVKSWPLGINPKLLDNGNLLDATNGTINGFQTLEELDWNGSNVWNYTESRTNYSPHHDFLRIYNPKLGTNTTLYIANKSISYDQCIAAGCNPASAPYTNVTVDAIVEVNSAGTVIWEWCFFDHGCQNFDAGKSNYVAAISNAPGRINFNLAGRPLTNDWLHCTSLDYNTNLDQIVISAEGGEFYVIDHGRTFSNGNPTASIALAASTNGDFIYRFGDPARYGAGTTPSIGQNWTTSGTGQKQIGGVSQVAWIPTGLPGAGHFLVFNNGQDLFETTPQSYIFEVNGYVNSSSNDTGAYVSPPSAGYFTLAAPGHDTDHRAKSISRQVVSIFQSMANQAFFSHIGGSVQRLANSNMLICSTAEGHIFEVTSAGEAVWEYINPVTIEGIKAIKSDNWPLYNAVYRATRYTATSPALSGRTLTVGNTIAGGSPSYISAPLISGVTQTPLLPYATNTVAVSATITNNQSVASATLAYVIGASTTSVAMTHAGALYSATIPATTAGTLVRYYISAADDYGNAVTNTSQSYTVQTSSAAPSITNITVTGSSSNAAWITAHISASAGVGSAVLAYSTGGSVLSTNTVFTETMATNGIKPWTGSGCVNAWTVTTAGSNPYEQSTNWNYGSGNPCGLQFKQGSANLNSNMITATSSIVATGNAAFVEFYLGTSTLTSNTGWTLQLNAGTGYVTRLSELTGTNHSWQLYHYDLQAGELVTNLGLRFQFAGGASTNRINLDLITLKTVTGGTTWSNLTLFDDGLHNDGAAGDGVYGVQVPAQNAGASVSYYLIATDTGGQSSTNPASGSGAPLSFAAINVPNLVLGRPTASAITVNALADTNLTFYFEYGTQSLVYAAQTTVTNLLANQPLEVGFSGLLADTRYYYRINYKLASESTYHVSPEYTFHTQRAAGSTFSFCMHGDTHPERAGQMFNANLYTNTLTCAAADAPDFYVLIGDDFSVDNIPTNTINQSLVTERYTIQRPWLGVVGKSAPLFLVNGNHEQASLANFLSTNLVAPGASTVTYSNIAVWAQTARNLYYPQPSLDGFYSGLTNDTLAGIGSLRSCYAWTWGDALFVTLDPYWYSTAPVDNQYGEETHPTANKWDITHGDPQYQWLKTTLEQSSAKYKFVFAHHVLGTGRGGRDVAGFYEWGGTNLNGTWGFTTNRSAWSLPIHQLMATNHVTMFVQGHDHIFVREQLDGVTYLTLPLPADNLYQLFNADAFTNAIYKTNSSGYVRFTVSPANVKVDYVRTFMPADVGPGMTNGMVDYSFSLSPLLITNVSASPAAPGSNDAVWVSAALTGTNVAQATLTYIAGGSTNSVIMADDGTHHDGSPNDAVFGAQIPALAGGSIVQYYVTVQDSTGGTITYPSGAPTNRLSYTVYQSVIADGVVLTQLVAGLHFTEGPAADSGGNIFFSDITDDTIYKWSLANQLSIFRTNSGGANGLKFDRYGNLLACEGDNGRLTLITPQTNVFALTSTYGGQRYNEPNDLWINPQGGVYFTDPIYFGHTNAQNGEHVYYLKPDRSSVTRVVSDMIRPNGLVGTSDGTALYIADWGASAVYRYSINADGTLTNKALFANVKCDGMTMDSAGNIYLTGTNSVLVYSSSGQQRENIAMPERPTNLAFGGSDRKTLFITTDAGSLYALVMRVAGTTLDLLTSQPPVIANVSTSPTTPIAGQPIWVTARVTADLGIGSVGLNYTSSGTTYETNTVFTETMRTNNIKPWTGDGCQNAWTVNFTGGNPFEQNTNANYGAGNANGLSFKGGTTNLADSMVTAISGIDTRGSSGTLSFYVQTSIVSNYSAWALQLNAGTGYVTRVSETATSNHSYRAYSYTLASAELVSNLMLRFQFSAGSVSNRIFLDQISLKTITGSSGWTNVVMYDDGLHSDGSAGDGVYGAQVPTQTVGTVVNYYISASDTIGTSTNYPAASSSGALSFTVTNAPSFSYDVLLGRPTDSSIAVSVLSDTNLQVYCQYGTQPGSYTGQTAVTNFSANTPGVITLSSLAADTLYYYRLQYGMTGSTNYTAGIEHTFHTQRARGSTFVFDIEADPHYNDTAGGWVPAVWQQTLTNVLADQPDFFIDLGDTFMGEKRFITYGDTNGMTHAGILDAAAACRNQFFNISGHSVPLFLVNGNHDPELGWWLTNSVPYDNPAVWGATARNLYYPCPAPGGFYTGATNVDYYQQAPRDAYYSFEWGNALFVVLDPYWYSNQGVTKSRDPWAWTLGTNQYYWLKSTLEKSTATFKFVFAHHLVGGSFDTGARGGLEYAKYFEWGGYNTNDISGFTTNRPGWPAPIQDLLLANGVQAFFHGHDHLFCKQDYYVNGITNGQPDLVYQEVPQPSHYPYDSYAYATGTNVDYNYQSGVFFGSSGHLRITVTPTNALVEYVRSYRPSDEGSGKTNRMVSYAYTLSPFTQLTISNVVATPTPPLPTNTVWVTATLPNTNVSQILLTYITGGITNSTSMLDDGAHHDGAAADATFGAQIPALPGGTVVKYFITAQDYAGRSGSYPSGAPTNWLSYTVLSSNHPPQIISVTTSPSTPTAGYPTWIRARVTDDVGIASAMLNYTGIATLTNTIFRETMATNAAKPWTGSGCVKPWTVSFTSSNPFEQNSSANYGSGNTNGLLFKTGTTNLIDSSITLSSGIDARGSNATLSFYISTVSLTNNNGWAMQLNPGTGYTTRLSETNGSNHAWQLYTYNLQAGDLVSNLLLRFQFSGNSTNSRIYLDQIALTALVSSNVTTSVAMYDDGAHGDSLANDGYFGAQIPAQAAGTPVSYYITATDLYSATNINPSGAPGTQYSFVVTNSLPSAPFTPKYVHIPGGSFIMGDHFEYVDLKHYTDEVPLHPVYISPLYMGTTLITCREYCEYLNDAITQGVIEVRSGIVYATGGTNIFFYTYDASANSRIQYAGGTFSVLNGRDLHPATSVRWFGAIAYCNWLSGKSGYEATYNLDTGDVDFSKNGFRLPTEAEWEFAAHGGATDVYTMFPWGNSTNADGTLSNWQNSGDPFESTNAYPCTTPVGFYDGSLRMKSDYNWPGSQDTYQTSDGSNPLGLYDMGGNVWEWCNDWYMNTYYSYCTNNNIVTNPPGPTLAQADLFPSNSAPNAVAYRCLRGGTWWNGNGVNDYDYGHARVSNRDPSFYLGGGPVGDPNSQWSQTGFRVMRPDKAAQTVGLFLNTSNACPGYVLMSPMQGTSTYLLNNAGQIVHQWTSQYNPGRADYLLENGHLLRGCGIAKTVISTGGGEGGRLEERDWAGNLLWVYEMNTSSNLTHHDFKMLPNGNVLMLAVEVKTYDECIAAGFKSNLLDSAITTNGGFMVPDYVVEVQPTRPYGGNIVWEWHPWDHFVQDHDPSKNNYGNVSNHVELIDPNGGSANIKIPQFCQHMNALDYNPQLDQIMLSVRNYNELWIIDHSTTWAEASGHSGGRSGKGGDLLYRWGDPRQYKLGTSANRMLYQQHDVQWIPTNRPGAGHILIFNNGIGRNYSSVDEIVPPVDASGNYSRVDGTAFGPTNLYWTYTNNPATGLYSSEISGAQRQPNSNTLICAGIFGTLFEVTPAGETVWRYINPEVHTPLAQGDVIPIDPNMTNQLYNSVFKVHRYETTYPGLVGKDLTPRGTIETYTGASTDTIGLGVPDIWTRAHFGTLSTLTTNSDHDADGLTDIQEFTFGTDPTLFTDVKTWNSSSNTSTTAQITVLANPVNGGRVAGGGIYVVGSNAQLSATASNLWLFTGWSDGETNASRSIVVPAGGATYTANFAALGIVSTFVNPTNGGSTTGDGTYLLGSNVTVTATASNNWLFLNWNGTITNNPWTFPVVSNGMACTASFAQVSTITALANPTNAGSVTGGGLYFTGSNVLLAATASNGWLFTGWNDGTTNNPRNVTTPATNITYTANFATAATISVGANTNAGGSVAGSGTFFVGSNALLTATASNGWLFIRWNDGDTNATRSILVASNTSYTAVFAPAALITVQANPASGGMVSGGGTYVVGSNALLSATASNLWLFTGWSDGETNASRSIIVPEGGATYTATFAALGTVATFANPTNGGSTVGDGTYLLGSNITLTATEANGWKFLNWNGTTTNNPWTFALTSSTLCTANFAQISTVTALASPTNAGSVIGGGTFSVGSNITLAALASNNWLFTKWNDNITNNPYSIVVPSTNITYTASFAAAATISVGANTNAGGSVSGSGTFFVGSTNWLTALASNNWLFIRWSDGDTNNPRSVVTASGGATYTAVFAPTALLTVQPSPTNGGSVSGGGTYVVGSNALLTATASNNWRFAGWNDGPTNTPRTVTVNAGGATYTANFVALGTVATTAEPAGGGRVSGGGTYLAGSNATLTATASNGWAFFNWNGTTTNNPWTFAVTNGTTLCTANFARVSTVTLLASPTYAGAVAGGGVYFVGSNITLAATSAPGWDFVRWSDGNTQASRALTVPSNSITYTATFTMGLGMALSASNLAWTTGGSAPWAVQTTTTRDGLAVRSGAIAAGQQSWMQTTTNGPGSLLFWWKNSTAAGNTLQFYVNTQLVTQLSGTADWNQYVTYIGTSNPVTLKWVYTKNSATVSGSDAGFVDQITWLPCPYAEHVPQLFFQEPAGTIASWVISSTGSFQFARLLANTGSWALKSAGDIDGDGVSDLLFQSATGDTGGWFLNPDGSVRDARFWFNIGSWEIKAAGDYEGLGRAQVLFQTASGNTAYWRLETNGAFLAAVPLGNMGAWKLRGAGDLDGDHKAELFWQNAAGQVAIWWHDGPGGAIRGSLAFSTGEWALSGVTDVDNDGVCDLIWQTPDTRTGGWFMQTNGTARSASFWWPTGGWKLKAAGR